MIFLFLSFDPEGLDLEKWMSNPIEKQRELREAAWEKQRAREVSKKPKVEAAEDESVKKPTLQEVEEQLKAERLRQAEDQRRAVNGVPLAKIQRDVVAHLRAAHRSVPLSELSQIACLDISAFPELLISLENHMRISKTKDGMYAYRPKYAVSNKQEMLRLIESSDEGVIVTELKESYFEAENDIAALKKEGKVFVMPNKILGSEILFNYYTKYDLEIPPTLKVRVFLFFWLRLCFTSILKEAWHHVAISDATKLAAQLMELKLPVAVAPVATKQKYVRKKQKKATVQGPGRTTDYFNNHVPDTYRDDSWKEIVEQMYGRNG